VRRTSSTISFDLVRWPYSSAHGPAPRCAGSYEDMPCQTVVTSVLSPGEARELVNAIAADAREAIDDMHEVEKASKPGPHQPD
jgi:hypothetical protein